MSAHRITLIWALRIVAALTLASLAFLTLASITSRPLIGQPISVAAVFLSTAWAALVAWSLAELLAGPSPRTSRRIGAWIMRATAVAQALILSPIAVGIISEARGVELHETAFSLVGLALQPLALFALAEFLLHSSSQTYGNAR